ncbi:hypothetical protein TNIN_475741 [Trichonephila inaurata madagascariensis]|uniref:Uncharacterized protein n=1 Tax=Trichonephila inaurata madagascariensis TaxID=2747483 RepID=A0A8X6JDQ6_9ARAC|nr:hypothetical protein TNIN_475741 [Trichonephila inaurata madagascariensis]
MMGPSKGKGVEGPGRRRGQNTRQVSSPRVPTGGPEEPRREPHNGGEWSHMSRGAVFCTERGREFLLCHEQKVVELTDGHVSRIVVEDSHFVHQIFKA